MEGFDPRDQSTRRDGHDVAGVDEPRRATEVTATGDELASTLERLAAATRADDAARGRRHRERLTQQATEEATFAGVLTDLTEQDRPVVLMTASGRVHRGRLRAVGADFVMVRTEPGERALVRQSAIVSVRTATGPPVVGDRPRTADTTFGDQIHALSGERHRVLVVPHGAAEPVSGELRWSGTDVVALRLDTGTVAYLPLAALAEVVWRDGA